LFKASATTTQALAKKLIDLLDKYGLRKKIIAYVNSQR
jgi:methanogenic corrinoid protein MtbC1